MPETRAAADRKTVLIVDDDPDILHMLTRYLEREEMTVISVLDALQALDVISTHEIDMVITDYNMPHVNGGEFLRQLKETPQLSEIPVVVMSAFLPPAQSDELLKEGAAFFLEKPLNLDSLVAMLRFSGF